jgi:hypothetical protein
MPFIVPYMSAGLEVGRTTTACGPRHKALAHVTHLQVVSRHAKIHCIVGCSVTGAIAAMRSALHNKSSALR